MGKKDRRREGRREEGKRVEGIKREREKERCPRQTRIGAVNSFLEMST